MINLDNLEINGEAEALYWWKKQLVEEQKDTAKELLNATDWYVVRKSETGTAIPDSVNTYRTAVRSTCTANENTINNLEARDETFTLSDWPTL